MNNCPRQFSIRERYETLFPYKSDLGLFMSFNPGDTLEHELWQDIIMACKIIAEKNNYFEDFGNRYKRIAEYKEFKIDYQDKSLG